MTSRRIAALAAIGEGGDDTMKSSQAKYTFPYSP